jgi:hypothetical protein
MPDALDLDPDGMVAKYRGLYLACLGTIPNDTSGRVERMHEGAEAIAREADRRRLVREAAETEAGWEKIRSARHGVAYDIANRIWHGLPKTAEPDLFYPEFDHEAEVTKGEWVEWVANHKKAGEDSMIDHLESIIPRDEGEPHADYRARLMRRRESWRTETDEVVVNRALRLREAAREQHPPPKPARRAP